MSIHATNKLTPNKIDPTYLRQELIEIESKLIPTLAYQKTLHQHLALL